MKTITASAKKALKTRAITAGVLILILAVVIFFGAVSSTKWGEQFSETSRNIFKYLFLTVLTVLLWGATFEIFNILRRQRGLPTKMLVLMMINSTLVLWACFDPSQVRGGDKLFSLAKHGGFAQIAALTIIMTSAFLIFPVFSERVTIKDSSFLFLLSVVVGIAIKLVAVATVFFGWPVLVLIVIVPIFTDTFAYLGGMFFGKNKMNPRISPKKTWEGAIIGTIFGTMMGIIWIIAVAKFDKNGIGGMLRPLFKHDGIDVSDLYNQKIGSTGLYVIMFVISLLLSIIGQIGDLVFSSIKRTMNQKDFSDLLPGHGGILDRVDSTVFALLMFFACSFLVEFFETVI